MRSNISLIQNTPTINNPHDFLTDSALRLDVSDFAEESVVFAYCKRESAYGNVEQFLQFLKLKDFM